MHVLLDPAGFDRWADLWQLLQQSFATMSGRIDPPSSLEGMSIEDLQRKATREHLIVALEADALIGYAFAAVREEVVYVGKLAVSDAARRRGVGRALMAVAEGLARQHQRRFVEVQTRIELIENHQTFFAMGFSKVAKTAHPGYLRPTSITLRKRVDAGETA